MESLAYASLILAAIPLVLGLINLVLYRRLPQLVDDAQAMSVLVPARNEAQRIRPVLESLLKSSHRNIEIVVADDHSSDGTREIVRSYAEQDERLRLIDVPDLPPGWSGKMHACHVLSQAACTDLWVFVDADVTVAPDIFGRISAVMARPGGADLVSGFPHQRTGSLWERQLIPLIHFLLIGFLPFIGLRFTNKRMFATGCGQLMAVRRHAYEQSGGHGAIRRTMHDGDRLPRLFRRHGFRTDLFDLTDCAATRMYEGRAAVFNGLRKNAHEGLATPVGLPVWTVLLGGGQVLPPLLALIAWPAGAAGALAYAVPATVCGYSLRFLCAWRFRQSIRGALLHPVSVAVLLFVQWSAFLRWRRGIRVSWKDRAYGGSG